MEEGQKHFVLVHGACHGAWCWYKVATLLKLAGHKVTALELAAAGVNPKQDTDLLSFSDYYQPLMEFMTSLPTDEKVILVGHSLGGWSLGAAMERFPEKVSVAVFVAAFMPGPDLSYISMKKEFDSQFNSYMDTQYKFGNGQSNPPTSVKFGPDLLAAKLYQLSPPEDLTLATMLMRFLPLFDETSMANTLKLTKEKYGSVPRIYVIAEKDLILGEKMQRWMIENNPTNEFEVVADSDHMVMFSKPEELCCYLLQIAKKYN